MFIARTKGMCASDFPFDVNQFVFFSAGVSVASVWHIHEYTTVAPFIHSLYIRSHVYDERRVEYVVGVNDASFNTKLCSVICCLSAHRRSGAFLIFITLTEHMSRARNENMVKTGVEQFARTYGRRWKYAFDGVVENNKLIQHHILWHTPDWSRLFITRFGAVLRCVLWNRFFFCRCAIHCVTRLFCVKDWFAC